MRVGYQRKRSNLHGLRNLDRSSVDDIRRGRCCRSVRAGRGDISNDGGLVDNLDRRRRRRHLLILVWRGLLVLCSRRHHWRRLRWRRADIDVFPSFFDKTTWWIACSSDLHFSCQIISKFAAIMTNDEFRTLLVVFAEFEQVVNVILSECLEYNDDVALENVSNSRVTKTLMLENVTYLFHKWVSQVDESPLRHKSSRNASFTLLGVFTLHSCTAAAAR